MTHQKTQISKFECEACGKTWDRTESRLMARHETPPMACPKCGRRTAAKGAIVVAIGRSTDRETMEAEMDDLADEVTKKLGGRKPRHEPEVTGAAPKPPLPFMLPGETPEEAVTRLIGQVEGEAFDYVFRAIQCLRVADRDPLAARLAAVLADMPGAPEPGSDRDKSNRHGQNLTEAVVLALKSVRSLSSRNGI